MCWEAAILDRRHSRLRSLRHDFRMSCRGAVSLRPIPKARPAFAKATACKRFELSEPASARPATTRRCFLGASESRVAVLDGADAHRLLDRQNKDLAVPDLPGLGRLHDRIDDL